MLYESLVEKLDDRGTLRKRYMGHGHAQADAVDSMHVL